MQEVQRSSVMSEEGLECPLVQTRVLAKASSGVVRVELRQRFLNPHEVPLDAEFRLPLPADAAVSGFSFRLGKREVVGELRTRDQARAEFVAAKKEGKSAAMLAQSRTSIFKQSISGVPPGQVFVVSVQLDQPLRWLAEGYWSWRFPTAIAARYDDDIEAVLPALEGPLEVQLMLEAHRLTGAPESPSHAIEFNRTKDFLCVQLAQKASLERDLEVRWPVASPQVGLHLALESEPKHEGAYGVLTIVPPQTPTEAIPQTISIMLDTSGSMLGAPLQQAKRFVGLLIEQLRPEDRLQLTAFSGQPEPMFPQPRLITEALKSEVRAWLAECEASGGTEMIRAVLAALKPDGAKSQQQVILVSDGLIGNESRLLETLANALPKGGRLHVVGVGHAPNRSLTAHAARLGRGIELLLNERDDVERPLARLLPRIREPLVTELKVRGDGVIGVAPERLPDLYAGSPVVVGLRFSSDEGYLEVEGVTSEGRFHARVRVPAAVGGIKRGLEQLYGRERIQDLEMQATVARSQHEHARAQLLEGKIETTALTHQVSSRMTSWVAVGEVVVRPRMEKGTRDLLEQTRAVLESLTPREERVLRMRIGIGEPSAHILEEVGADFDLTRERIRSIEAKALTKLKHPSRANRLRAFLEEGEAGDNLETPKTTHVLRRVDPSVPRGRLEETKRPEWPKELARQPAKDGLEARCGTSGLRRIDDAKELLTARRGAVCYPAPKRRTPVDRRNPDKEAPNTAMKKTIQIGDTITVAELSQQMSQKAPKLIGWLMKNGVMATINQPIEHETAVMLCAEFGFEVESKVFQEEEMLAGASLQEAQASHDDNSEPRAPVVTVMGHVDHGKTSLLDRIRNTKLAAAEAGGITQRIAGYQVKTKEGLITFMDTPGHGAFVTMRARGANVTDIVVLVVAADDGVKPQTLEAIKLAKSANVPIVVALNKIDKSDANPDRVLKQLADASVLVEAWGGDVPCQYISAKTGDGVDELLELLVLQAEVLELKADSKLPAVGTVIEGYVHKGRGPVASVLIREGSLKAGEVVVVGEKVGKVRALTNDAGKKVKVAGPSSPVELLGLDGVPSPGDELRVAASLEKARELAAHRRERRRAGELATKTKASLEDLLNRSAPTQKELKIVVKADQQGTAEAVREQLSQLSNKAAKVQVLSAGVGAVVESDVDLAKTSDAFIVGFSVKPDAKAIESARTQAIEIICHKVIYEIVDAVQAKLTELLPKVQRKKVLGQAEVLKVFRVPKIGSIAGCAIREGVVNRSSQIILRRNGDQLFEGRLASLKREKNDVTTVRAGMECGLGLMDFSDIEEGDVLEAFEFEEVSASE